MLNFEPTGEALGATARGEIDLAQPLSPENFSAILGALGTHGVIRFPNQRLDAPALKAFSERFGELQIQPPSFALEAGLPEIAVLSNVVENGKRIGVPDAGQDWHTDMTYNSVIGFVNVLVAFKVPVRDGKKLGGTEFVNTQAACADLPAALRARLETMTATHDLNKYWEYVRRVKGSQRPPLTEQQRREKPPVTHPVLLTHPITGREVIYVNPAFTERVDGLSASESDDMLQLLFDHMLQPRYRYLHEWDEGDLLIWDHIGTWHSARADYAADEPRLMKRCQVMATRIFDPAFQQEHLPAANGLRRSV